MESPHSSPPLQSSDADGAELAPMSQKQAAAQAAVDVIETIISTGAKILWRSHQKREILRNTTEIACEVACSHLSMCFVPHDSSPLIDAPEDWLMDDEPESAPLDSWARNVLEVVRKPQRSDDATVRMGSNRRTRPRANSQSSAEAALQKKNPSVGSRMTPLHEARRPPQEVAWEESLRTLWAQHAAARAIEQEDIDRSKHEEANKESRARAAVMEELKERRPFAFDSSGRVMFFEFPVVERFPKLPPAAPDYEVTVKHAGRLPSEEKQVASCSQATAANSSNEIAERSAQPAQRRQTSRVSLWSGKKQKTPPEVFTDGCRRLEHAQPPLAETMQLQRGVILECGGRTTTGPTAGGVGNRMAWREYVNLCKEDNASQKTEVYEACGLVPASPQAQATTARSWTASEVSQNPDPAQGRRPHTAPQATKGPSQASQHAASPSALASNTSKAAVAAAAATTAAAVVCAHSWVPGVASPLVRPVSAQSGPLVQNSPAQPAPGLLASRAAANAMASFGVLRSQPRLPRQKVINIGGHGCSGAPVQPPLGATMGHGLLPTEDTNIRSAVMKGEFYFPSKPSKQAQFNGGSRASLHRPQSASVLETRSRRSWR
eukprot:TRINITY_DN22420_c0_g1_i1.p1 TRINITY_DN22420_c0_g1~~TRINITY_DN22420_c0_g1_i1.p1  ORF type:complete len:606 (-),score=114.38 TRINITY_DN22420_c0_g1_i1:136-1953(-)